MSYRSGNRFGRPLQVTVRMLWDRCLFCLSVCNINVLWSNSWMNHGATWYRRRPQPRPY